MPLTQSEALVAELCRRSFLTLWSEPNPIARAGKELCDLLVVCSPHVIIFSVKEVALKDTGNVTVDWDRWRRKAIDDSVKQLYGAERRLQNASRVVRSDGAPGLALPPLDVRRVHRVAVALGGRGSVPYQQGDFGKGFVHVLDEQGLRTVVRELDTITDFVDYLAAKEELLSRATVLMEGQEEDLLAFYVHQGRVFPQGPDMLVIGDNLWTTVTQKPEWIARKEADRESYVWDGLIETLRELSDLPGKSPTEVLDVLDGALGFMARETRFGRRMLTEGFNEFMRAAVEQRVRARMMPSLSDVGYVFLACSRDENREERRRELALRCFVARGLSGKETVIGIATERYQAKAGFSLDAVRITKPTWGKKEQEALEGIQRDLGYFVKPKLSRATGDEFPVTGKGMAIKHVQAGRNQSCPCGSGKKYKKCHGSPS